MTDPRVDEFLVAAENVRVEIDRLEVEVALLAAEMTVRFEDLADALMAEEKETCAPR